MSASAAVRGSFRLPFANDDFRETRADENTELEQRIPAQIEPTQIEQARIEQARAQSIAYILHRSGLTITQLSKLTRQRYGIQSSYFVPPTFLYKIRGGITPHICQVAALSETTGYRFVDWIRMLGFDLQHIPRLQLHLHWERTALITPIKFQTAPYSLLSPPEISPATHLTSAGLLSKRSLSGEHWRTSDERFFFAKIGSTDAALSRGLTPGMIVRVDRSYQQPTRICATGSNPRLSDDRAQQNSLWLVEHSGGLTCCQVQWIDDNQIILVPARPPLGSLPLRVPSEARILGLADLEPEPARSPASQFATRQIEFDPPRSLAYDGARMPFPDLLRAARRRTGLTFRAAHHLTLAIARIFGSRDYAIGLGALSDYETVCRLPRHIAKIISLCITYSLDIRQLMESAGVYVDDSDKMSLPVMAWSVIDLPVIDLPVTHRFASGPDFLDGAELYTTTGLRPPSESKSQRISAG
jgi:hypothetical protein